MARKLGRCDVCGEAAKNQISWRCSGHCRCDDCGASVGLCYREGGLFCDQCWNTRVKRLIAEFEKSNESTEFETQLRCPFCGNVQQDAWELSADDGVTECGRCDRKFEYTRTTTTVYSSSRPGSINTKGRRQ
jgi:hypothetical protein